jgi:hypothetical protein
MALIGLAFINGPAAGQYFNGYPCTSDCSGHEAGYEWAERHGIDNPDDCGGNSNSFIEGCQSWAEEQRVEEQDDNFDSYGFGRGYDDGEEQSEDEDDYGRY